MRRIGLVFLLAATLAACAKDGPNLPAPGRPRVFRMAVVPFPAEPGPASFFESFSFAGDHAEAVSNHFDAGIPWESALAGHDPPAALVEEFAYRRYRAAQLGLRPYVALGWLDASRDSLAPGWGRTARPAAVNADPSFANPSVRAAIKFWTVWMALYFEPDAMSPGIEINLYEAQRPDDWPHLVSLYREVYDTLKIVRSRIQVFPTWQLDELHQRAQWPLLSQLDGDMDAVGVSLYPGGYLRDGQRLTPYNLPADYLGRARAGVRAGKPMWVTETGYGDSALAGLGTPGTPAMQRDYLEWLAWQCDSLGVRQLTWFFPTDPWAVLESVPHHSRGAIEFFGPMGLRRRDGSSKLALLAWDQHLRRPYQGSVLP